MSNYSLQKKHTNINPKKFDNPDNPNNPNNPDNPNNPNNPDNPDKKQIPDIITNDNSKYWEKFNNRGIMFFLWGYTIFTWTLMLYLIWNRNKDFFAREKNYIFFPLLIIPYIYILIGISIDFQFFVPQTEKTSLPPIWNSCLYFPTKKDSWIAKYDFNCAYNHDSQTIQDTTDIANRSYYLVYVLLLIMLVAQKSDTKALLNNNILLSFSSAALLLIFITSGLMTLNTYGLYSIWVLQYMKAILCMTGVCIIMIIYIYFHN